MKKGGIVILALVAMMLCGTLFAQEAAAPAPGASAAELEALKAQLGKTEAALNSAERRIQELEAKVGSVSNQLGTTSQDVSSLSAQLKGLEGKAAAPAAAAAPGIQFKPYGYIKIDMVYDDTRTSGTDATAVVLSEKPGFGSDKHFSITARQTRLGVNIVAPDVDGAKQAGKIEVDFYAPASVENKAELMLRQAYWQLTYPNWNVLVGQTFEVMSPAFPNTINYSFLAICGNAGYRKPMVRYERTDKVFGDKTLQTDVAVVRSLGSSLRSASSLDDEGSDAGWPVVEARAGISFPTSLQRPLTVGISGHTGQEEYDTLTTTAKGTMYSTYSGNVDFAVPLAGQWDLMGEFFSGRNLDAYMGGAGQGVNTTLGKEVDAVGGWAQLCYRPTAKWALSAGVGIDDPDDSDLNSNGTTAPITSRNAAYFTNAWYALNDRTKLGLELTWQDTKYKNAPDGDNIRVQSALQFNF